MFLKLWFLLIVASQTVGKVRQDESSDCSPNTPLFNVLITGANRGLGLEFVRQYLKADTPPMHILAACRDPSNATMLQSLTNANQNVHILKLDVTNYESFPRFVEQVSEIVGSSGLAVLINNAGILRHVSLSDGGHELMLESFVVNAVSPFMLVRSLLPIIEQSKYSRPSSRQPTIVIISSVMGSIEENTIGGHYAYRTSKAGLNMISKSLQLDLEAKGIRVAVLHPGSVQTDMGGPDADMTPELSVSNMIQTIERVSREEIGNDGNIFLNFDGNIIPW